jgi:hypothetical protein
MDEISTRVYVLLIMNAANIRVVIADESHLKALNSLMQSQSLLRIIRIDLRQLRMHLKDYAEA